ncbi:hypothetical protein L7F22_001173 [Adiantum nelumboides]|nr:hypothetical protein [Adiantum nelumboides]
MARILDCRRKKHRWLNASADMEDPNYSEEKQIKQNGDVANGILGVIGNSDEKKILGTDVGDYDTESEQNEVCVRKECTKLVLRRLKQTGKHSKKVLAKRKWLSAHLQTSSLDTEKDPAGLQQLLKLKATVERLGGKLDNGWHVTSQRRSNNGLPFFSFISPTKEKFRSRIEVVRYLGLPARPAKSRYIPGTRPPLPNSQLALVPFDRQTGAVTKSSKAPDIKDCEGFGHAGKVVFHALNYGNDPQMTSTPSLSSSVVTERCQDILRSLISTESFATVSNLVGQVAPSLSMDAFLQLKGPSFLANSLDLKLIHLRLSTGAYGQSPELFSKDIQQGQRLASEGSFVAVHGAFIATFANFGGVDGGLGDLVLGVFSGHSGTHLPVSAYHVERWPPSKASTSRAEDHRIELIPGAKPPSQFLYRLSKALEGELETNRRPLTGKIYSPIILTISSTHSLRHEGQVSPLCVDYRALNKLTIKNKFPMPRIEYILEPLDGAKFFTKIDLKSGYHQIRIFEADIPKTAFRTERGHYDFVVIPFGLTRAPGSFNKNMCRAFAGLIGKCVFIFLDDILVFSATYE